MKYIAQLKDGLFYIENGYFTSKIENAKKFSTEDEVKKIICCYPFNVITFEENIKCEEFYQRK